jgi:CubicO group peptidase (beta-lactamase class C family)
VRRSAWAAGLVVALLGLAPPAGASPAPAQQIAARLHTQLSDLAKTGVFSGELLVTRGSERLLHATFSPPGTAGPPAGACYRIASITKSFTATAILLLAERGQLTLDDAIADHVPVLDRRGFTKDGQAVTLDHLLTHTSGLTGIVMAPPWGRQFTTAELAASFADAEVSHRPGTHYQYSNPGYVLLGQVIERKSGKTYEAFVRDEIAGPLGLGHTGITRSLDPCPLMPGQVASALGLHNAREVFSDVLVGDYVWSGGSSGALYANVDDLVRFVQALPAGQLLRRRLGRSPVGPSPRRLCARLRGRSVAVD